MRAMFESSGTQTGDNRNCAVMLNAAWPKMYWQLYDYYLMPNGAFYGARKANEPLHIAYDYGKNSVLLSTILTTRFPG